jgi:RNA ligase (TIGR02306 family)
MSSFECPVVKIRIEAHPNADAIEIARVGDYQSIVKKGQFQDGDFAVYIPEQAVVPEWLLREMGMYDETRGKGGLAGALGNRVKAIKLRGVVSQGLVIPTKPFSDTDVLVTSGVVETLYTYAQVPVGGDAAEAMGITKYEPKIPSHMAGRIIGADFDATAKYDFDNLKKTPDLFQDGEEVAITEKIHGTLLQVGVVPSVSANDKYYGGRVIISSKGMGAKGFVLDHNDETNLYAQAAKKHGLLDFALNTLGEMADEEGRPAFVIGEVFGKTASGAGVQDLTYTDEVLDFRAFDICVGNRGSEKYAPLGEFIDICDEACIPRVPLLYVGPYSKDIVLEHTNGETTLGSHIREGVVVKSYDEVVHPKYGRKIAKSVSDAYLLRKGETTEFQ